MEDDDRRCPQIDWLVRVGQGGAFSKKKAARVLTHVTNPEPDGLCRDCHPLGEGYRLGVLMSAQEDTLWRRGFHIIGGAVPSQEQPADAAPRAVRISPQAYRDDEAVEREVQHAVYGDQQAADNEVRRFLPLLGPFPKRVRDQVLMSVRWPPQPYQLN